MSVPVEEWEQQRWPHRARSLRPRIEEQIAHERAMAEVSDVLMNLEHAVGRARKARRRLGVAAAEHNERFDVGRGRHVTGEGPHAPAEGHLLSGDELRLIWCSAAEVLRGHWCHSLLPGRPGDRADLLVTVRTSEPLPGNPKHVPGRPQGAHRTQPPRCRAVAAGANGTFAR